MTIESSELASEVASALTHRDDRPNPTENVDYNIIMNRNNLYNMTSLPYDQRDIARQQEEILGPLSLYAPYSHEEIVEDDLTPERPVTPVDEEIKMPIATFKQLSGYVLRRITADESRPYLDVEDQEDLAGVLLGELNAIWTDLYQQADDPFLTREQNLELKRLMIVRIVEICTALFNQYVEKAQILNRRGVFTGPANVSRLKAQLGLEAHRNFNVPSIRRWAAEALKGDYSSSEEEGISDKLAEKTKSSRRRKPSVPSIRSSPRRRSPKRKPFNPQNEIKEMNKEMPTLKTEKLISVLEEMEELRGRPSRKVDTKHLTDDDNDSRKDEGRYRKKRSNSVDETHRADTLAEELEIDLEFTLKRSDSTHLINIPCLMRNDEEERVEEIAPEKALNNDLANLMARPDLDNGIEEDADDMPPLLQAITRNARHDNKKQKIEKQLEELRKKEEKYKERQKVQPHEKPKYPQPDTVSSKLPNNMSVRASDVRVSERVCMSSFTIDKFGPMYNDLMGEVDQATVKAMDKNLFMGDEIKEVYQEIMKTIPTDHLTLSNDGLIQPSADSVNLSSILMPSALHRRKKERVVNKDLQRVREPPWKNQNVMQWAKTPVTQLRDIKPDSFGSSRKAEADDVANIPGMVLTLEDYKEQLTDCPRLVQERLSRNYMSWLTWWKSTLSSEDYQKYLASQQTDYLCYMFHYYDSDGDDSDNGQTTFIRGKKASGRLSLGSENLAEKEQLDQLRAQKSEYIPGFWNPCSVLMGGLGKDPVLEDEDRSLAQTPASDITQTSHWDIGKRLKLKTDFGHRLSIKSAETELSKTILNKQTKALDEARRIAEESKPKGPTPQERLEKVWSVLQMPDHMKLDMAIKYSSDRYSHMLDDAIVAWESATDLVMDRERTISQLENFERLASDPNRFFEKGFRGSSKARLDEAKQRSHYYKLLDDMEGPVSQLLTKIEADYNDKVSFQGRPYLDKMQWDRIEMLFWLQEERKQHVLEKQSVAKGLQLGMGRLESNLSVQPTA